MAPAQPEWAALAALLGRVGTLEREGQQPAQVSQHAPGLLAVLVGQLGIGLRVYESLFANVAPTTGTLRWGREYVIGV